LANGDVALVGGKNASLGEMMRTLASRGVRVPEGFAVTAEAYRCYLEANDLGAPLRERLQAWREGDASLAETGDAIRRLIGEASFPRAVADEIRRAYGALGERYDRMDVDVAVRSSATAEDLPDASFAGQQDTYLNISGADALLDACRRCYASLFTDRAIAYRDDNGFDHLAVALSVGVQKMVRSDSAGAGVMFSIDTETGFPDAVILDAAWGLGESVVKGTVNPDRYTVFKPLLDEADLCPIIDKERGDKDCKLVYGDGGGEGTTRRVETTEKERRSFVLSDDEILTLGRWAKIIEEHYGRPMDIEWAKDGDSGELFIVQARPETVQSHARTGVLRSFRMIGEPPEPLVEGLAVGQGAAAGTARILQSVDEADGFEDGDVLVTERTDPDWVPVMQRAAGIVTSRGGRTSHAAIVSRELGVPAVVGAGNATEAIESGGDITVWCASGQTGRVYRGALEFEEEEVELDGVPDTGVKIMMNIASPETSFRWWSLPVDGVGLARMEFIINNDIQVHPLAVLHPEKVEDEQQRDLVERLADGYDDPADYFVHRLALGIARIAAPHWPDPVVVRLSDFKSNEYAALIGGRAFEPDEANPMLGWRGASRYYSDEYREAFALECRALRRVREVIGLDNVIVMVPFCRTPEEADRVLEELAGNGLVRGEGGLKVYVMAEVPSNVILAEEFAVRFDGLSIGSNDLTQLILGVDRDSTRLAPLFDERNEAVRRSIEQLIRRAHDVGCTVSICGQAPSDYPEFAAFLVEAGIDSLSLNPDSVIEVRERVAEIEQQERQEIAVTVG
ncbi:MAG: phosphoenolpyruvate synthase, partial [Acidobacteriota bacterium]